VKKWKKEVIDYMTDKLNWTNQEKEKYSLSLEDALTSAVTPADEQE